MHPWRTHSCVQRSHSCERVFATGRTCSQECEHGRHEISELLSQEVSCIFFTETLKRLTAFAQTSPGASTGGDVWPGWPDRPLRCTADGLSNNDRGCASL